MVIIIIKRIVNNGDENERKNRFERFEKENVIGFQVEIFFKLLL